MVLERVSHPEVPRQTQPAQLQNQQQSPAPQPPAVSAPPYIVNISPRSIALAVDGQSGSTESFERVSSGQGAIGPQECQACNNRKYVDRSNDASVSFQSPTRLSPATAETAVRAHEQEHVTNEKAKADQQGRKVVAQNVAIHYAMCPECGRSYVAGGTTTTVTKADTRPGAVQGGSLPLSLPGGAVDLEV